MPKPLLIDTHSHVNFKDYKNDGDEVIKRALDNGVWMINAGAQYSTSCRAVEYAEKYKEGVYAAVGLHPSHVHIDSLKQDKDIEVKEVEVFDAEKYKKLLENPKTVAIGEIGLDYGNDTLLSLRAKRSNPGEEGEIAASQTPRNDKNEDSIKHKQKEVLVEQIELAQQMNKPIVFHCRGAYNDLIELLEMFNFGCANCPHSCSPKLRGTMHCFVGRLSQAEKLVEMGFHLGFNGIITYARDYDKVIKKIPLGKILLETDAPYLTPIPHRGERNEPSYVKYVAEKIAEVRGVSFEEVAKQTTKNARELFGI
ncbi:MAG: TatD family hydrolase [Patescibacteria group bacterium]|nr:TatD family hydrolase [Patescibacteria group bacterium]